MRTLVAAQQLEQRHEIALEFVHVSTCGRLSPDACRAEVVADSDNGSGRHVGDFRVPDGVRVFGSNDLNGCLNRFVVYFGEQGVSGEEAEDGEKAVEQQPGGDRYA